MSGAAQSEASHSEAKAQDTIFEKLGGDAGMQALAARFYEVMDENPDYAALRAMHAPDLAPVREAFAGFLTVWLGGPRDWLTKRGGFCLMSRHAGMGITDETASQWLAAMREAMAEQVGDAAIQAKMDDAFTRLAKAMAWNSQAAR